MSGSTIVNFLMSYQEDHDSWYEPPRHLAVEKLEVVDEAIFIGAAINTTDKITCCRVIVQLSKI